MFPGHASDEEDQQIATLRNAIEQAFPAATYTGPITRHDGAWLPELTEENALLDDDKFLYEALKDQKWTGLPKVFLQEEEPNGYLLLNEQAFAFYLAAWLVCSLEDIDGENTVREYLIYAFSPGPVEWNNDFKMKLLRALNPEQRAVLRLLMIEFARREASKYIRQHAVAAISFIDSCR